MVRPHELLVEPCMLYYTIAIHIMVMLQEMYTELIAKKSKIEEQLKDVSIALTDMEVIDGC